MLIDNDHWVLLNTPVQSKLVLSPSVMHKAQMMKFFFDRTSFRHSDA